MSSPFPPQHSQDLTTDDEMSLLDVLRVIAENLRLLIVGPIVAGLIGLVYAYTLTPIFTAITVIVPPTQGSLNPSSMLLSQLSGLSPGVGGISGVRSQAEEYKAFLESNTLRNQLIEQFKLIEYYKAKNYEAARKKLSHKTTVVVNKKTNLITISVSDQDPQFAANLANAYVSALSQMLGKMFFEDAKHRQQLLEQQINEAIEKSYRSPFVREAIIQSVVREYETAILDQKKDRPHIQLVDKAEAPELKSEPKLAQIAMICSLTTGFILLLFVFIRNAFRNANESLKTKASVQNIFAALRQQLPW